MPAGQSMAGTLVPEAGQAIPGGQSTQVDTFVAPVALEEVPGGHGHGRTVALGQ
tara:strand:- start:141 stop:302 length:162 start_codon:yes stop_codon:yes gene_type:complete